MSMTRRSFLLRSFGVGVGLLATKLVSKTKDSEALQRFSDTPTIDNKLQDIPTTPAPRQYNYYHQTERGFNPFSPTLRNILWYNPEDYIARCDLLQT